MAQFGVYRTRDGDLLLDCQLDILDQISSRFVVPLMRPDGEPIFSARFNPTFAIDDEPYVMKTQYASTVAVANLGKPIAMLDDERYTIIAAIDFLLSGF